MLGNSLFVFGEKGGRYMDRAGKKTREDIIADIEKVDTILQNAETWKYICYKGWKGNW